MVEENRRKKRKRRKRRRMRRCAYSSSLDPVPEMQWRLCCSTGSLSLQSSIATATCSVSQIVT